MLHIRSICLLALFLLAACAESRTGDNNEEDALAGDTAHLDAMTREHAADAPVANASTMEPAQEVVAEEVVYGTADGQPLRGYLARPQDAASGSLPGVVVIHEWWGLNDNIRMMTRRLAGEGYVALAVDMYGGQTAATPEEARNLMQTVMGNRGAGLANLHAAADYLQEERNAEGIGVIGWCFGGGWSLQSGLGMPEMIDAAVMYYGQPVTDRERLAQLDAPLLGLFGAEDQGIPLAEVRQMEQTLADLGKDATIRVYEGANHAFANPSGERYDAAAAEDAWERTVAFFAEHLKGAAR